MKELYFFYLSSCPYCRQADALIEKLCAADPKYREVKIRKIEERLEKELADSYDYYFVPCFFLEEKKLHEGAANEEIIKNVLEEALKTR